MNQYIPITTRGIGFLSIALFSMAVGVLGLVAIQSSPSERFMVIPPDEVFAYTAPVSTTWVPGLPERLVIPAIAVDAPVQAVKLDPTGTGEMAVPSNYSDVGWYEPGVRPGMPGSAVIAGHVSSKTVPEAVFYHLPTLVIGDEVVIMHGERVQDIFEVVAIKTYAYDDPATDVFVSTDGKKRLNLITCSGNWISEKHIYSERTVVFTELLTDSE